METVGVCLILAAVMIAREWRMGQERQDWARERQQLLQRIQAPEQAVVDHSTGQADLTFHIPFDDDEEAFLAREQMNGRN
jgi:hypothetical protein